MDNNGKRDRSMYALCIESSHIRGMGHLYRALNLADALSAMDKKVKFYLNAHKASLDIIRSNNYAFEMVDLEDLSSGWEADLIERDAIEVWINDRLDTDTAHAERIKARGVPLVTFDDKGTGAALSDLHIAGLALDYSINLEGKRLLRGVDYMVLNPEIAQYARSRTALKSIIVTLGGSDTHGVTVKVVESLVASGRSATVVVGPSFEHFAELDGVVTPDITVKRGVPSMIAEFANHDLAITGGGVTPFEANASGLPCIVIANEDFEIPVGKTIEKLGGAIFAGHHTDIDFSVFHSDLPIEKMSKAGMTHVTLQGIPRIVEALSELVY